MMVETRCIPYTPRVGGRLIWDALNQNRVVGVLVRETSDGSRQTRKDDYAQIAPVGSCADMAHPNAYRASPIHS